MKIKTSTLIGPQLDWAVATVSGIPPEEIKLPAWGQSLFRYLRDEKGNLNGRYMTGPDLLFSTKWEAGGPIIEREHISTKVGHSGVWIAYIEWNYADEERHMQGGPTPLIAALRCYVASHLGDEVEIPDELARQ